LIKSIVFSVGSDSFSVENMQQMAQESVRCSSWNKLCPITKTLRTCSTKKLVVWFQPRGRYTFPLSKTV